MTKKAEKKNLAEAVYRKLKNIALTKNRPFQEILQYYAIERFLYRLSVSPYKGAFYLKGGLMLRVWDPATHRTTVDIDLLVEDKNSLENISRILQEICSYPVRQDGSEFNSTDLILAESQIEREYVGLSACFSANLHTAKLLLRIDIGFGDKIFPKPAIVNYPALLNFPSPLLKGYTPETMIAEKLDACLTYGRMKDFYDIWTIVNRFQFKLEQIAPVIREVFQNRKTIVQKIPNVFSEDFYNTPRTMERWDSFLKDIGQSQTPFEKVIVEIRGFFLPILNESKFQGGK